MKSVVRRFSCGLVFALPFAACGGDDAGFVSSGRSRGVAESVVLMPEESYGGLLNDIEVAVLYDAASSTFIGRLRNEAVAAICDLRVDVMLDGSLAINTTVDGAPLQIEGLTPRGRTEFALAAGDLGFSAWTVRIESFSCDSAPEGGGAGGEGEGGHEGGEGGGEHGGEGGHEGGTGHEGGGEGGEGGEEGDEASPPVPRDEPFMGVFNQLNFSFAFDVSTSVFRGVVENQTSQRVCRSRTEIHVGVEGAAVVELGPTIDLDLDPGQTSDVVIEPANAAAVLTYTLHPESSPCP